MCPIALKKLIQGEDSSYHIRKILEIIREGALEVQKDRTRLYMLRYEVRRHKSRAKKKYKI